MNNSLKWNNLNWTLWLSIIKDEKIYFKHLKSWKSHALSSATVDFYFGSPQESLLACDSGQIRVTLVFLDIFALTMQNGLCMVLNGLYSIHVPGWLQKWLNLITAPGSVSNEPGSVTWLATKYLKTVSWRNHTEKLTTWWPQNISFWPKINIPSSYFTILMLNCLKILSISSLTAMWQLSDSWPNQFQNNLNLTWPSNTAGISLDSRLEYSKITHRYAKVSPFTWFLCWKLPIDTDFIHFICHFHQAVT